MLTRNGPPSEGLLSHVKNLIDSGAYIEAERKLSGAIHGARYDPLVYEMYGRALYHSGQERNAGRFLFLSGLEEIEYAECIKHYLNVSHDPKNFRQLYSTFPIRVKELSSLSKYPRSVRERLLKMGFPEDIHAPIMGKA